MATIQIFAFHLADGTDEETFIAADKRVQAEFTYQQPGVVRRTTARGDGGNWAVITVWQSAGHAKAAGEAFGTDPVAADFMTCIDESSVRAATFETLD